MNRFIMKPNPMYIFRLVSTQMDIIVTIVTWWSTNEVSKCVLWHTVHSEIASMFV